MDLIWDRDEEKHKAFINNLAPIVLFTYNRLDHTKKTIESLQKNVYASESVLYIYSDGPKNERAIKSVNAVRDYLHTVTGFKEIHITEREENWGMARNIIDGVTGIVNQYGKIIVLEDDIVTSKWFLKYMNDALEVYKLSNEVMEISGNFWAKDRTGLPDTFFLPWGACWGWATWKRAWSAFKRDPQELVEKFSLKNDLRFNLNGAANVWEQVEANYRGDIYTWAVFWDVAIYRNYGLVLFPNNDMSINIGIDGSGENCGHDNEFWNNGRVLATKPISDFSMQLVSNQVAEKKIEDFYKLQKVKKSIFIRIYQRIKSQGLRDYIYKFWMRVKG